MTQAITLINPILDQVAAYPADGTGVTDQATDQTALGEYISDQIIKYCIPGFVLGISSAIIYFIGYLSMISEKNKPS